MAMNTRIKHLETVEAVEEAIANNERLMISAGRWGPMCIPVYGAMEELEADDKYKDIVFRVIEFDVPAAIPIRQAKECRDFRGLPFTLCYRNGKVVCATSSIQTKEQLEDNIQRYLLSDGEMT
jgi:thioredoxin 1